jgi:hypothetical protein
MSPQIVRRIRQVGERLADRSPQDPKGVAIVRVRLRANGERSMNATTNDEEVLRRYLLGNVASDVREHVEQRLFSNDMVFCERLSLVEDELIDDYVNQALDRDATDSFERSFVCTEDRQQRLAFARALKKHADQQLVTPERPPWSVLGRHVSAPIWAVTALVFLVTAVVWRVVVPRGQAEVVTVSLISDLVRSASVAVPRVRIPPECKIVELRLQTDSTDYSMYSATLHDETSETIWSQNRLSTRSAHGRTDIAISLPADLLRDGDYYVRLRGQRAQQEATLNKYDFRVLRR